MGKAALSWLGLSSSEEEDSTHDEGERFEVRPQFEGPAGQKVFISPFLGASFDLFL